MTSVGSTPVGENFDFGFEYPDDGYSREFSDQEIIAIQDGFLVEQLKLLTDKRASPASRQDAMDWLTVPLVTQSGVSTLALLSFQRCCYAYGANPAEVQEQMIRLIAPQRLQEFGYE